jgi:polysaccharide chain length determinant protein (PEP-CTERM system associated)
MHNWKVLFHTYLSGAWHYRWAAMAVTWVVCLLGWAALAVMPNQFQAVAKIYVDTDTMMAPLLRGLTVSTDPDQQVSVMLNTLLTRPNLEQVVRLTAPAGANISTPDMAREVQRLQENITLKPLGTKNLYEMAYTNKNPNKALSVSQSLLSIFVDSNIGTGHRALQGATAFLDDKVAEYENLVREAEQRRAAFRQANLDVLSNSVTPEQARAQIEKARQDVGAAQARLGSLRAQLAAIPKIIFIDGPGPVILSSADSAGRSGSLLQRLSDGKQLLIELRSRFTDDHPDVKAAKRQVEQLQAEVAATPAAGAQGTGNQSISNPVYVQTQGKMSDAMTEVAFQQQKLNDALQAMEASKKMTARGIEISTKFADLDRDYDLVHKTYQELLTRRESARISQSVNDQQSAVTVRIVEPPRKAPFPVAPNRPLINSLILLAGIAAGLATAIGLAISAGRFYAKEQLSHFDYPIIGVITRLPRVGDASTARAAYMVLGGSFLVLMAGYIGVLTILDATFRGTLRAFL